jgi:hypothetical protein
MIRASDAAGRAKHESGASTPPLQAAALPSTDEDRDYYARRVVAELDLAHRSENPAAAEVHFMLATLYLDLIGGDDRD